MAGSGSLNSTEEWLAFKSQVHSFYPNFFDALEARISLRPEKTKLCVLILLDAGTQEICDRLGMSKHAVHLARISLAERFELTTVRELQSFLRTLAKAQETEVRKEKNISHDHNEGLTSKEIRDLQSAINESHKLTSRIQAIAADLFTQFGKPRAGS